MKEDRFIVAEVSRNWPSNKSTLISQEFAMVISHNLDRGYILHSWQLRTAITTSYEYMQGGVEVESRQLVETIIAVFEKKES